MKLFAKRKRKSSELVSASGNSAVSIEGENSRVFQSDPVVEELLKLDPSTWNSKQRRMVNRYQERKIEFSGHQQNEDVSIERQISVKPDGDDRAPNDLEEGNKLDSAEDKNDDCEKNGQESQEVERKKEDVEKKVIDSDLEKLLSRVSSKQRRKLTRMLEREENVDEVRKEALNILGEKEAPLKNEMASEATDGSRKAKRRKTSSTSGLDALPPEERLRREEQRRLQKEAAERCASGEMNTKHKHPLNSERRRANRRKPAYAKRKSVGNEHHASGFDVRRRSGQKL